jgi:hypothetical protein
MHILLYTYLGALLAGGPGKLPLCPPPSPLGGPDYILTCYTMLYQEPRHDHVEDGHDQYPGVVLDPIEVLDCSILSLLQNILLHIGSFHSKQKENYS